MNPNSAEATNEATKLEGDLDLDEGFSVGADDADTFNDIAEQNLGSNKSVQEQSITAEFWLTNRHAKVGDVWKMTITKDMVSNDGTAVTNLAPPERRATADETYDTVFWQARVLSNWQHQTTENDDDKTASGTEIDSIRFQNNKFQYHDKNENRWESFNSSNDQLVFYYLIRTDYSQMVQIDVSDWTVKDEPSNSQYPSHRGVTYQVIVDGGNDNGKVLDSKTFWYNRDLTVSAIRVRQTQSENYTISKVELTPNNLGTVAEKNGEYQFSLNLKNASTAEATVKIYVKPNVQPKHLSYQLNGGTIDTSKNYTAEGEVYPDAPVVTPSVSKEGCTFDGWYTDADFQNQWTGTTMPSENLTLYAKWTKTNPAPDPDPDPNPVPPEQVEAMFFINLGGKDASKPDGSGLFTHPAIVIDKAIDLGVFSAHATPGYGNKGYIFNKEGVKTQYPSLLNEEPTFEQINEKIPADKKGSMSVGEGTGREVVWYHVSDCTNMSNNDGYHVDGYIKNVAIKITYDPDGGIFAGEEASKNRVEDGKSGEVHTIIQNTPTKEGSTFTGWKLEGSGDIYQPNGFIIPTGDVTLVAQWTPRTENTCTVKINRHLMKDATTEVQLQDNEKEIQPEQSKPYGTNLSGLIQGWKVPYTHNNENYTYVEATCTVGSGTPQQLTDSVTLSENTVIDLYYYLDNWKDGSSVKEDNEKGGDGIPDCDQVLIKYVSSNSDRGTVSPDMEVLTIREGGASVVPTANGSTATRIGSSRNYFSNWTDTTGKQVSTNATLNHQTILDVIKEFTGGKTYTFTANFGYSSGGGSGGSNRPKPPVVEIPDDVPTGLNGKDHYAYIIGYGNNDVRPQNNITRAEVATIFFRLLTDETRTANMTKSNGYNDVKDGDWFCCAVSTLSKMGIIKGYEDGSFKPNAPISRAEFAAIAARFDPDGDKTPATFADVTSHWAKDEISIAANHGWIKGYEDGSFKPDQKITRAETMTLVNRVLNRLPEAKDDLHKDMKTWVDNMDETAWYYLAVQEATNSHYFKNKTSTKFEQWTDLRDTRDWSELEK